MRTVVVVGQGPNAIAAVTALQPLVTNCAARVVWVSEVRFQHFVGNVVSVDVLKLKSAVTDVVIGRVDGVDAAEKRLFVERFDGDVVSVCGARDAIPYDLLLSALSPEDVAAVPSAAAGSVVAAPSDAVRFNRGARTLVLPDAEEARVVSCDKDVEDAMELIAALPPRTVPPTPEAAEQAQLEAAAAAALARQRQMADASDDDDDLLPPMRAGARSLLGRTAATTMGPGSTGRGGRSQIHSGVPPTVYRRPHVRFAVLKPHAEALAFLRAAFAGVAAKLGSCSDSDCSRITKTIATLGVAVCYPGWTSVWASGLLRSAELRDAGLEAVSAAFDKELRTSGACTGSFTTAVDMTGNAKVTKAGISALLKLLLPAPTRAPRVPLIPSGLAALHFGFCGGLGDGGVRTIVEALCPAIGTALARPQTSLCPSLTALSLNATNMTDEGAVSVAGLLQSTAVPALKHLDVSSNAQLGVNGAIAILEALTRGRPEQADYANCALESLLMREVGLNDDCATILTDYCRSGEAPLHLDLSHNTAVTHRVSLALRSFFACSRRCLAAAQEAGAGQATVSLWMEGLPRVSRESARFLFEAMAESCAAFNARQSVSGGGAKPVLPLSAMDGDMSRSGTLAATTRRASVAPVRGTKVALFVRGSEPLAWEQLECVALALSSAAPLVIGISVTADSNDVAGVSALAEALERAVLGRVIVDTAGALPQSKPVELTTEASRPRPDGLATTVGEASERLETLTVATYGAARVSPAAEEAKRWVQSVSCPSSTGGAAADAAPSGSTPYHAMAAAVAQIERLGVDVRMTLCRSGPALEDCLRDVLAALPDTAVGAAGAPSEPSSSSTTPTSSAKPARPHPRQRAAAAISTALDSLWDDATRCAGMASAPPLVSEPTPAEVAAAASEVPTDAQIGEAAVDVAFTFGARHSLIPGPGVSPAVNAIHHAKSVGPSSTVFDLGATVSTCAGWFPARTHAAVQGSFEAAAVQTVGTLSRFVADVLKFRPATAARFTAEAHQCVRRSAELLLRPEGAAALAAELSWDNSAASTIERSQRHDVPAILEQALGDLNAARPQPSLLLLPPKEEATPASNESDVAAAAAIEVARNVRDDATAARQQELAAVVVSSATSPAASEAAAAKAKQQKALKSGATKKEPSASEPMLPPGAVLNGSSFAGADDAAPTSAPEQAPLPTFAAMPADTFAGHHALSESLQKAGSPGTGQNTTATVFAQSLLRAHLTSCGPCQCAPQIL